MSIRDAMQKVCFAGHRHLQRLRSVCVAAPPPLCELTCNPIRAGNKKESLADQLVDMTWCRELPVYLVQHHVPTCLRSGEVHVKTASSAVYERFRKLI